jgi:uncharacterized protein (DUF58 family)
MRVNPATRLSAEANAASAALPPLLAEAERAAASIWGVHGRRSAGSGETFWQYRHAQPGDSLGSIDWRRSGRSDDLFVRETEWETAQSVFLWPDESASMQFASRGVQTTKGRRAAVLALSTAILLERGDERFALMQGRTGVNRLSNFLSLPSESPAETGTPPETSFTMGSRALFISDFFGDLDALSKTLSSAVARRVRGILLQVVDPVEEAFPYSGRVLFESIGGGLRYDADRAESLRDAYRDKLEARRAALKDMARQAGWTFAIHRTDTPPTPALMMIHQTLQAKRVSG